METQNGFFDVLQQFMGGNPLYVFVLCAAILLLMNLSKGYRRAAIFAMVVFVLFIFNPISYRILLDKFGLYKTYYRFLWMIPTVPLLAYLFYETVCTVKDAKGRVLLVIMTCLAVFATNIRPENMQLPSNVYQISDDVVDICNQLENLIGKRGETMANIVTDPNISNVVRQYDAHVCLKATVRWTNTIDLGLYSEDALSLMSMLTYDRNDMPIDAVGRIIENYQIDYLVPPKVNVNFIGYMQQLGWNVVGETEGYYILANETI